MIPFVGGTDPEKSSGYGDEPAARTDADMTLWPISTHRQDFPFRAAVVAESSAISPAAVV